MNYLFKLLYAITVLSLVACSSSNTQEEANDQAEDNVSTVEEVAKPQEIESLINPNLASEEELKSAGLNEDLVVQVVQNRPFMSMTDFDTLLGDEVDNSEKEKLYTKLFIPFNLNTTPEDDFKLIPGVGDRMAHEFEEYRPYVKVEQFRKEIGKYVDESEVARFEKYVFVPVELNTASQEEILAIPGVGERMLHEFEEYRPYKSLEQFRKEIGKYVDDKELSRLERFVYLSEDSE